MRVYGFFAYGDYRVLSASQINRLDWNWFSPGDLQCSFLGRVWFCCKVPWPLSSKEGDFYWLWEPENTCFYKMWHETYWLRNRPLSLFHPAGKEGILRVFCTCRHRVSKTDIGVCEMLAAIGFLTYKRFGTANGIVKYFTAEQRIAVFYTGF